MKLSQRVAIIGGGSYATALAKVLNNRLRQLHWWIRKEEAVNFLKQFHHNPDYLSYVEFNTDRLQVSSDLANVIEKADIVIFSLPAAFLHPTLQEYGQKINLDKKIVVSVIKGLIPEESITVSDYFEKHYNVPPERFAAIGGPCHAEELVMEKLSYLTIAAKDESVQQLLTELLTTRFIKVSMTPDYLGVEYASALKNIYAVAAGICIGLGYGDNFLSVLTTNSIQEMKHFLLAINHCKRDINQSVYSGDLIVTIYSQFSRNRAFGNLIGKGYSVSYSKIEMKQVAEGYYAVKAMKKIMQQYKVDMPILEAVYAVLYENISPALEMKVLAERLA